MTSNISSHMSHLKINEGNHVEKPLLTYFGRLGRGIISLIQNLLTGKKRVTPLLTKPQEAGV